jgi:hypothetical protein
MGVGTVKGFWGALAVTVAAALIVAAILYVPNHEIRFGTLENRVGTLEGANLDSRVKTLETLQGKVAALEGQVRALAVQNSRVACYELARKALQEEAAAERQANAQAAQGHPDHQWLDDHVDLSDDEYVSARIRSAMADCLGDAARP